MCEGDRGMIAGCGESGAYCGGWWGLEAAGQVVRTLRCSRCLLTLPLIELYCGRLMIVDISFTHCR